MWNRHGHRGAAGAAGGARGQGGQLAARGVRQCRSRHSALGARWTAGKRSNYKAGVPTPPPGRRAQAASILQGPASVARAAWRRLRAAALRCGRVLGLARPAANTCQQGIGGIGQACVATNWPADGGCPGVGSRRVLGCRAWGQSQRLVVQVLADVELVEPDGCMWSARPTSCIITSVVLMGSVPRLRCSSRQAQARLSGCRGGGLVQLQPAPAQAEQADSGSVWRSCLANPAPNRNSGAAV